MTSLLTSDSTFANIIQIGALFLLGGEIYWIADNTPPSQRNINNLIVSMIRDFFKFIFELIVDLFKMIFSAIGDTIKDLLPW